MTTLSRWSKFNLVGAAGMPVQLAALAFFHRCFAGHYLCASAAAVELTLLHNFFWHLHFTWRDRGQSIPTALRLLRFQLSNGLVSLLGNLGLMRLLMDRTHIPLLASNLIAILCCSTANFFLSYQWAFASPREGRQFKSLRYAPDPVRLESDIPHNQITMSRMSAGLLMYRCRDDSLQVLLVHPGGPFWAKKDIGAWSIPKGEHCAEEAPLAAARREFAEETGFSSEGPFHDLGLIKQGGKIVRAWAFAGDCDPAKVVSNTCHIEWPPRSGRRLEIPEVDRGAWFTISDAHQHMLKSQTLFLHRLCAAHAKHLQARTDER